METVIFLLFRLCWKRRKDLLVILILMWMFVLSLIFNADVLIVDTKNFQDVSTDSEEPAAKFRPLLDTLTHRQMPNLDKSTKLVLFWNLRRHNLLKEFSSIDQRTLIASKCPIIDCEFTMDVSRFNKSDVVIFSDHSDSTLPKQRFQHQHFIFLQMESPASKPVTFNRRRRYNFFNRTMTYRLDSDIILRKNQVIPKNVPTMADQINNIQRRSNRAAAATSSWKGKTKLVAWFPSSSKNASDLIMNGVKKLSRYVTVDIIYDNYGNCSTPNSSKFDCYELLRRDYKFYLAFEDSLCKDHVTEQFFLPLYHDTVPVVLGGADYSKLGPPHSFIEVKNFDSVRELAEYLLLLNRKDNLYDQYFEWKEDFKVDLNPMDGWCDLCQLAHDPQPPVKVYHDIKAWWAYDDVCDFDDFIY